MDSVSLVGVDFGGASVRFAIVREEKIEDIRSFPTEECENPQKLLSILSDFIKERKRFSPKGVGIGLPGFVNFNNGFVYDLPNVPNWPNEYLFHDEAKKVLDIPFIIENDSNCMTYAEWKAGSARGMENFIGITLGTGVGSGLVINNQLVRGHQSMAGEIGQTSIEYKGESGKFGNLGALEKYVGTKEIIKYAEDCYQGRNISEKLNPETLSKKAKNGDKIAIQIWKEIAEKIACALINYCWLLNPEAIILGGGIARAGDILIKPLEKKIQSSLYPRLNAKVQILPAHFQKNAGIIGSALLAKDHFKF